MDSSSDLRLERLDSAMSPLQKFGHGVTAVIVIIAVVAASLLTLVTKGFLYSFIFGTAASFVEESFMMTLTCPSIKGRKFT